MHDSRTSFTTEETRFAFGENWARFLGLLNDERIREAEASLRQFLDVEDLNETTFLDVGSGSGLFSLAARRMGAHVRSFDYDPNSVACTEELRKRYYPDDPAWIVERGDALDENWLSHLDGPYDIVYSWGVLHHTGEMWRALDNIGKLVMPGGKLFIAIYNDQGRMSRVWNVVKRLYNYLPGPLRYIVLIPSLVALWAPASLRDLLIGKPFTTWRRYARGRGMSPWHDLVDWVGGYPMEVAKPESIFDYFRQRGFTLQRLMTCGGGHGCNQFLFTRAQSSTTSLGSQPPLAAEGSNGG